MGTSDFLTILITQLQNQDPLSPTDTDAMVTELCALTQVETLNNIQTQLSSLSGMGQWASTIGDYMQVSDPTVSKGDVVVLVPAAPTTPTSP
jgi:flagellar basal-body rod modification protein FlgD